MSSRPRFFPTMSRISWRLDLAAEYLLAAGARRHRLGLCRLFLDGLDIATASLVIASLGLCSACVATFGLQVRKFATAVYVVPDLGSMILGKRLARGDQFGVVPRDWSNPLARADADHGPHARPQSSRKCSCCGCMAARISAEREAASELVQRAIGCQEPVSGNGQPRVANSLSMACWGLRDSRACRIE